MLVPDVVLVSDAGGVVRAAIRPVSGAKTVARLLSSFSRVAPGARVETTWLNGAPALRVDPTGEFDTVVSLTVEGGLDHPHLRDPQSAQAGRTRHRGDAHPIAGWRRA